MDSEKNTAAGRKSLLRRHTKLTLRYVRTFVLWAAAGLVIGALGGLIGTAFCYAIREATQLRGAYPWLLYFLPAGGLLIVWLYRLRGMHPTDTNGVLLAIHAPTSIPGSTAPLIFVGTTITHLFGGSAGREGAALQLGGVLGYQLGRALKLDEKDIHLIVMCGMSSVFSALFGSAAHGGGVCHGGRKRRHPSLFRHSAVPYRVAHGGISCQRARRSGGDVPARRGRAVYVGERRNGRRYRGGVRGAEHRLLHRAAAGRESAWQSRPEQLPACLSRAAAPSCCSPCCSARGIITARAWT